MSEFFQDHPMLLFALEAGVALFLLIFIVVWTMGTAKKHPRPSRAPADHPSRAAAAAPGHANQASQPSQANQAAGQANQATGQAHSKDNAPGV